MGWAHGLAAAGAAADADAPLLMVTPDVPASTAALVGSCGQPRVDLLLVGDALAIPAATITAFDRLDGAAC